MIIDANFQAQNFDVRPFVQQIARKTTIALRSTCLMTNWLIITHMFIIYTLHHFAYFVEVWSVCVCMNFTLQKQKPISLVLYHDKTSRLQKHTSFLFLNARELETNGICVDWHTLTLSFSLSLPHWLIIISLSWSIEKCFALFKNPGFCPSPSPRGLDILFAPSLLTQLLFKVVH